MAVVADDRGTWTDTFPGNFLWSNATLIMKGMAPYGVVSLEEIDRVCRRLAVRQDEPEAWIEEWSREGERIEKLADEAAADGRDMTAGNLYFRAAHYIYNSERFIQPDDARKRPTSVRAYRCYHEAIRRRYPEIQFVEVPYEGTTLPAFFLPAAKAAGPAPTVVIVNGMDNTKEMSIIFAGLEFSRRGFNVLTLDGPGQGESLRLRGLHSRFDYEAPGGAAFDHLETRPEVDRARVAIMGYSFGGYYACRIAAFEKRYRACIAFSALHWDLAAWQTRIKEKNQTDPTSVGQSNFQFRWVVNAADADAAIAVARQFSLKDVARLIDCPILVTHGQDDRIVPVDSAHKVFEAIGSDRKTLKIFTRDDGASEHAHVDHRQLGIDFAADWLARNI